MAQCAVSLILSQATRANIMRPTPGVAPFRKQSGSLATVDWVFIYDDSWRTQKPQHLIGMPFFGVNNVELNGEQTGIASVTRDILHDRLEVCRGVKREKKRQNPFFADLARAAKLLFWGRRIYD